MNRYPRLTLCVCATLFSAGLLAAETSVLREDFSDVKSGWDHFHATSDKHKGFSVYNETGGYQMTPVDDNSYGVALAPQQASGADVRVAGEIFLYTGIGVGSGGVVCRYVDAQNFYAFMVSGKHGYGIVKMIDGKITGLTAGSFNGSMPNIAEVKIEGRCQGDKLSLYLDGKSVASANDADLPQGKSGLVVLGEKMAGTSAVFDSFELAELSGG